MDFNITLIKGDGIGPEIVDEAIKVLDAVAKKYNHDFSYNEALMGGVAIDATGVPLPEETVTSALASDSVLLGSVGGPKWDNLPGHLRPEAGLLGMRKAMELYANIRPAVLFEALKDACPLRKDIAENGFDMVVVRELTGGIYFGERGLDEEKGIAFDTETYSVEEIERITKVAIDLAKKRKGKIWSIDKANVLESSRLWRKTVAALLEKEDQVEVENMLVDNAAMQLVRNPSVFDVVLTSNMFGDILSDEAAAATGSLGMLPSASLGATSVGLYEPSHGSAPDIAGQNKANPLATILSAAMMLRYSFNLDKEADDIEKAVNTVLEKGYRTADIASEGTTVVACTEMGSLVANTVSA